MFPGADCIAGGAQCRRKRGVKTVREGQSPGNGRGGAEMMWIDS